MRRIALLAVIALLHCARTTVDEPRLVIDRSACARCGMLISDARYAAAIQVAPREEPALFDDANCLLSFTRSGGRPHRMWFRDAAEERWIDAAAVTFVRTSQRNGPMGTETLAFSVRENAERYARAHQGTVIAGVTALEAEVQP